MKVTDLAPWQLKMAGTGDGVCNILPDTAEAERLRGLSHYEEALWADGIEFVAGLDEVGRGPIAGPVVVAAVILPPHLLLPGINDSKKLSPRKRYQLEEVIRRASIACRWELWGRMR